MCIGGSGPVVVAAEARPRRARPSQVRSHVSDSARAAGAAAPRCAELGIEDELLAGGPPAPRGPRGGRDRPAPSSNSGSAAGRAADDGLPAREALQRGQPQRFVPPRRGDMDVALGRARRRGPFLGRWPIRITSTPEASRSATRCIDLPAERIGVREPPVRVADELQPERRHPAAREQQARGHQCVGALLDRQPAQVADGDDGRAPLRGEPLGGHAVEGHRRRSGA